MRRPTRLKKLSVLLTLLALFCWTACPPATVSAAADQPKEEVVYATLSSDGSLEQVYVVNSFSNLQGKATDYGTYNTVTALSGQGDLSYQDGVTTIENGDGAFYYQGELTDPVLPWLIQIEYTLDGRTITPEALGGASGLLTTTIQIRQSPDCDPFFFENYALQISIPFDSDCVQNIQSEGATVASSGSTKTLSYIVFPGQETSLSFQAEVEDFQLSGIQIAGISLQFSVGEFDMDELLSGVYQLQDGLVQLDQGAQELDQGVGELRSGASDLASGLDQVRENLGSLRTGVSTLFSGITIFRDGLLQLSQGASQYTEGVKEFADGIQELSDGVEELESGIREYQAGLDRFATSLEALPTGVQTLESGMAEYTAGAETFAGKLEEAVAGYEPVFSGAASLATASQQFLDELNTAPPATDTSAAEAQVSAAGQTLQGEMESLLQQAMMEAYTAGCQAGYAAGYQDGYTGAEEGTTVPDENPSLSAPDNSGYTQALDAYTTALAQFSALQGADQIIAATQSEIAAQYGTIHSGLQKLYTGLCGTDPAEPGLQTTLHSLVNSAQNLATGAATIQDGIAAFSAQVPDLMDGIRQLQDGVAALLDGIIEWNDNMPDLLDGMDQLQDGAVELQDGTDALLDGNDGLVQGAGEIDNGMGQLQDGATQLTQGGWALSDGMDQLQDGTTALKDGTGQMRLETGDMDSQIDAQINQLLEEYGGRDFTPISFVSPQNTQIESVQFVMQTSAIQLSGVEEEVEAGQPEEETVPAESTFWQRLQDLGVYWQDFLDFWSQLGQKNQ